MPFNSWDEQPIIDSMKTASKRNYWQKFNQLILVVALLFVSAASNAAPDEIQYNRELHQLVQVLESIHPNPWRSTIPQAFKDQLSRNPAILRSFPVGPWLDISRALTSLDPEQQDTVSGINLFKQAINWHLLPLELALFDDGIFITATEPDWQDYIGHRLLTINGKSADQLVERIANYFPSHQRPLIAQYLRITELLEYMGAACKDACQLTVSDNDQSKTLVLSENHWQTDGKIQHQLKAVSLMQAFMALYPDRASLALEDEDTLYWRLAGGLLQSTQQFQQTTTEAQEYLRNQGINHLILDFRAINRVDPALVGRLGRLIKNVSVQEPHRQLYVIIDITSGTVVYDLLYQLSLMPEVSFVGEPVATGLSYFYDPRPVRLKATGLLINIASRYQSFLKLPSENNPVKPDYRQGWIGDDFFAGQDSVKSAILDLIEINRPD